MTAFLAYIYWNANPDLLKLGPLTLRWYGLLFGLGFYLGYLIVHWEYRIEGKNQRDLGTGLTYMILGAIIGARLAHCFFYEPGYYLKHPLEILMIWEGGLASHGGAAGILIALYFYSRSRPDQPYLWLLDRIMAPAALAGAFIRLGNLFNSEILGRPTTLPWAFVFQRVDAVPRHPVQLYESSAYFLIFIFLLAIYWRRRAQTPRGLLFGWFLVMVFTSRFFIEFLKERQAAYEQNLPLSVGQWLSLPFIAVGVFFLWRALRGKKLN